MRPEERTRARSDVGFQFTHPGKGATSETKTVGAPGPSFNSRTLGRVRQFSTLSLVFGQVFQFTHPGKGATTKALLNSLPSQFQFTHPGKGATTVTLPTQIAEASFNSRTLGRVRRILPPQAFCSRCFNSRTLGRVRQEGVCAYKFALSFNSRTLGRVRPDLPEVYLVPTTVSIHAPWEGCDSVGQHPSTTT